jgi:hypothetical protein
MQPENVRVNFVTNIILVCLFSLGQHLEATTLVHCSIYSRGLITTRLALFYDLS